MAARRRAWYSVESIDDWVTDDGATDDGAAAQDKNRRGIRRRPIERIMGTLVSISFLRERLS